MPKDQPDRVMSETADRVRTALSSADVDAFRDLLDPDASWGPPDDAVSGCHNRDEVLAWYQRGRAAGTRAEVTEVLVGPGRLLVGLKVMGGGAATDPGDAVDRWQVMTVRDGRITDIRGFDDRAEAAARAGVSAP